ncbi:twin-arginine translocase TatA/TatE family subunit [Halobacteriales archaeon SW_7_68_16]|nr:MAG: twin-arginine translocase TatA/TatE family subunit [Halobacteriales archaeon SW_7_68_16]
MALVPLFVGGLGPVELGIVFMVLILLFGSQKIPKLARSSGQAIGEFQKGRQKVEEELQEMEEDTDAAADIGDTAGTDGTASADDTADAE